MLVGYRELDVHAKGAYSLEDLAKKPKNSTKVLWIMRKLTAERWLNAISFPKQRCIKFTSSAKKYNK